MQIPCLPSTSTCQCAQLSSAACISQLLEVSLLLYNVQAQPRSYGTLGVMSGPLLAGLTGAYVGAINAGAVPTIATAWQVRGSPPRVCKLSVHSLTAAYQAVTRRHVCKANQADSVLLLLLLSLVHLCAGCC
jgi:hypothetical protein